MSNKSEPENKDSIKNKVSKILDELSMKHDTEFIEADMVALFEDIVKFFSGREEDFLNFDTMNEDAKQAIYTEIKTIIMLLKNMGVGSNKEMVMKILGKNLITHLNKYSGKFTSITDQLNKKEQQNLKRRFADAALLELYQKRRNYVSQNKEVPEKLNAEIEGYIKEIRGKKIFTDTHRSQSSSSRTIRKKQQTLNASRRF